LLCRSEEPTLLAQCSARNLKSYAVSFVGTQLELSSGAEALHLRAFRTEFGPALFLAMADPNDHSTQVWMGLPAVNLPHPYSSMTGIGESTLRSSAGRGSEMLFIDASPRAEGGTNVGSTGGSNWYFLYRNSTGKCVSDVSGQLPVTALKGLSLGTVKLSECTANPIQSGRMFHIQSAGVLAMLGATGGPFAGRWVFAVPSGI